MAVLCDSQIRELVGIEPFAENVKRPGHVSFGVSSYGYDVRVGTLFKVFTNVTPHGGQTIVDPKNFTEDMFITIDTAQTGRDHIIIPPNSFVLAENGGRNQGAARCARHLCWQINVRSMRHYRERHAARTGMARQGHDRNLQHNAASREDLRERGNRADGVYQG